MSQLEIDRIAVIGAGKMGTTLIHAILERTSLEPQQVVATRKHSEPLAQLSETEGIATTTDNIQAIRNADLVLLCVKPQIVSEVLKQIGPHLDPKQVVVSVAAGVTTMKIEAELAAGVSVIRAMPNTASLIGAGMTAICAGSAATEEQVRTTEKIFSAIGRTVVLDENHFDAVTGLAASGPAFIYIIVEALAEGGVKVGLPRSVATELAAQACFGAAKMVLETGAHPALLKDDVTTPAGCTMDGILTLEEGGLRVTLIKAVVEATRRSGELGG